MPDHLSLSIDDYIGAVKLDSTWKLFYADLIMWILDYETYAGTDVREGSLRPPVIRKVDETNAEAYCEATAMHEIPLEQV